VPNVFFLISIALIWHYPLGPGELARIRAGLAARG
jgi:hypothetical protein